jgi:hypothetical protein
MTQLGSMQHEASVPAPLAAPTTKPVAAPTTAPAVAMPISCGAPGSRINREAHGPTSTCLDDLPGSATVGQVVLYDTYLAQQAGDPRATR